MIYFTSDLHIGHNKPFIYEARGFSSIEEHDTTILKKWNDVVTDEDTVFILGDLCLGQDEKEWNRIFYNLNGKEINFITGNHDTNNKIDKYVFDYNFVCCGWATYLKYSKKWNFYLSHYPTYTENPVAPHEKPFINLYGHTHQKDFFFNSNPYMYNVGVDAHNLTPVSIETIIKDIKKYKFLNEETQTEKYYWKIIANGRYAQCSKCGRSFQDVYDFDNYDNYCRHCGAKMEGIKS